MGDVKPEVDENVWGMESGGSNLNRHRVQRVLGGIVAGPSEERLGKNCGVVFTYSRNMHDRCEGITI